MLHPYLRSKTDDQHQQLELTFGTLLKSVVSEREYVALLKLMAGFLIPLEESIHAEPLIPTIVPDLTNRKHTHHLKADIAHFDPDWEMEHGASLPFITGPMEALGALYVLEGSTMGGPIIAKMIRQQTGLSDGLSYFESYGAERKTKWMQFKLYLDNPVLLKQKETVTNAAVACFRKYKQWLETSNPYTYDSSVS